MLFTSLCKSKFTTQLHTADRQVSAKIPADEVKRNLGMCRVCCPKRPGLHAQLVLVL